MIELTKEERRAKFLTIQDLTVNPSWVMMVDAITEIQGFLTSALKSTKFTSLNDIENIQNEIVHYEKLKNLPQELMTIYDEYNPVTRSADPYAQIDVEYEENLKKGPQ